MIEPYDPISRFLPLWGEWEVDRLIGEGSYGRVYHAYCKKGGSYEECAVKLITIPKNDAEVKAARSAGHDEQSLYNHFQRMADSVAREITTMQALRHSENIVRYEDHKIYHEAQELKWYVMIRMELLMPLDDYISDNLYDRETRAYKIEENTVKQIGTALCNALSECEERNIIHRDIKESNVFVDARGVFKLGDFGIAREMTETSRSMSMRGTPAYLAPEIYRGDKYGHRADIYSLGILLYKLLNNYRHPFLPPAPEPFSYDDTERAFQRRMKGEELPLPANGSYPLQQAVLRACAYQPDLRFRTAEAFKEAILEGGTVPILINPNSVQSKQPAQPSFQPQPQQTPPQPPIRQQPPSQPIQQQVQAQPPAQTPQQPPEQPKSSPKGWIIGGAIAAAAVIVVLIIAVSGGGQKSTSTGSSASSGSGSYIAATAKPTSKPTATPATGTAVSGSATATSAPRTTRDLNKLSYAYSGDIAVATGSWTESVTNGYSGKFQIAGKSYSNGIGIFTTGGDYGEVTIDLNGSWETLTIAAIGADSGWLPDYYYNEKCGTAEIVIYGDGSMLYRSGDLWYDEVDRSVKVDVTDVWELVISLETQCNGAPYGRTLNMVLATAVLAAGG